MLTGSYGYGELLVGAKTALTYWGLQPTPPNASQYRADNKNFRKSGSTFCQGTVFAPEQYLYRKEATGLESPKMYSSSRCKNHTYLCRPANYPISCKAVYSRERKFAEILVYLLPWYRVSTKGMFIFKRSYGYGEQKNIFL